MICSRASEGIGLVFLLEHAFLIPVDGLDLLDKLFQLSPTVLGRTRQVLLDHHAGVAKNLHVVRIQFRQWFC